MSFNSCCSNNITNVGRECQQNYNNMGYCAKHNNYFHSSDGCKMCIKKSKVAIDYGKMRENDAFNSFRYLIGRSPLQDLELKFKRGTIDIEGDMIEFAYGTREFIPQRKVDWRHSFNECAPILELPEISCSYDIALLKEILNIPTTNRKPYSSKYTDFSHLNINKMQKERLNRANELNRQVISLKEHKRDAEKCMQQEKKVPEFSLTVTCTGQELRNWFIPSGFAKQYLSNIDKEIRRLEKEIEKL